MFLALLPWVGAAVFWVKMKYRTWRNPPKHTECEDCEHVHHVRCAYARACAPNSDWAGNHAVSCTCEEEEHRDREVPENYRGDAS